MPTISRQITIIFWAGKRKKQILLIPPVSKTLSREEEHREFVKILNNESLPLRQSGQLISYNVTWVAPAEIAKRLRSGVKKIY